MTNRSSTTDLPVAVATYLTTSKELVGPIVEQLFTTDAVVHDEGRTHVGLDAIRDWADGVAAAFTFTRTIIDVTLPDSAVIVRARLEGDFPGSPVELHHHFSVADSRISALTICP